MAKRSTFGSKFGTIAVVGGSVIGLGNIWRFPYVAGENGGAVFILIYITASLLISVPIMLTEFSIGKAGRSNALRVFRKLSPVKGWQGIGYLGIATAFCILAFYCVTAGWAMKYIKEFVTGEFMPLSPDRIKMNFDGFVASGWRPVIWTFVFVALTGAVVGTGVERGIERFNKAVMPLMLLILIVLCVNSFSLDGFRDGAAFILTPDFSKVDAPLILSAVGQSFFSMSVGMGAMITYGSYIKSDANMFRIAGTVAVSDVLIAILSGLAIFPAVFTFGISPTSGPDLVFLALPNIFAQMTGGQIFAILFFLLLFAAAITSSVSLLEVLTAYVSEEFRLKRSVAAAMISFIIFCLAALCAISQMPDSPISIMGRNLFDLLDHMTAAYMMPLCGLLIVIFAGWVMDKKLFRNELTSCGTYGNSLYKVIWPMVRFVIPMVIAMLFLNQAGLLNIMR